MTEPLRVLVAISGAEDPALVADVAMVAQSPDRTVTLTILHVVDSAAREMLGRGAALRSGPWPGRAAGPTERRLEQADEEAAVELLETWRARFAATLGLDVTIVTLVRRGRAEQEIIEAIRAIGAGAVVLSPRPRVGPAEAGPHSLGHVARFVTDHSPVPVVMARHSR